MSTLINFVEGVATAALKYFLDPKEPVLELKPLTGESLSSTFIRDLAEVTLKGKKLGCHVEGEGVALYRTPDNRVILTYEPIDNIDNAFKVPLRESWDEIHRRNISMLWNLNNDFRSKWNIQRFDDLNVATFLTMAIAESQRARLVKFEHQRHGKMIWYNAIFATGQVIGSNLYKVSFCSDTESWDTVDHGPNQDTSTASLTFVSYDQYGRVSQVTKRSKHQSERLICELSVAYPVTDNTPHFTGDTDPIGVIPKSLYDYLHIKRIITAGVTICTETGYYVHEYACITDDMQSVVVKIRH